MSASLTPAPMVTSARLAGGATTDLAERAAEAGEADDLVRLGDVLLLQVEQVGAAGQQFGLAPLVVEQRQRPSATVAAGSR